MPRVPLVLIVAVALATGAGAPKAQAPAAKQRLWTGTWEEHDSWEGSSKFGRSQAHITYAYVQGPDEFGGLRWDSRRLTWSAQWEERGFDFVATLTDLEPDSRGFTSRRYQRDYVTICTGGGTLELGPEVAGSGNDLTPAQRAQLLSTCVTTYQPRDSSVPTPPPSAPGTRELLQVLGMPNEDQLTGCAYETSWPKGGRPAGSFSASVSAPIPAVMEVDPKGEYGRFVPVPGQTLTFTASVLSGTARFRFELDPDATSHFPGYATNADVDDAFFANYSLARLRGLYTNDGPDVMFSPKYFGAQEWSLVEPLVVETARSQSAAVVTLTAMDYGAVGRLRAFVKSDNCGDWQPVPVRFGRDTRESVTIPMDEDHNLMADALEDYRGRASGADDDAQPEGNGTAGDGLTAFEEYRGFMTATHCDDDHRSDLHVRTRTGRKDLFIATNIEAFAELFPSALWSEVFNLDIHALCGRHIIDGEAFLNLPLEKLDPAPHGELTGTRDARIVNFTFQRPRVPHAWMGHVVSQDYPQRALVVTTFLRDVQSGTEDYPLALAIPVEANLMGPPGATTMVIISDDDLGDISEDRLLWAKQLVHRVLHEVGHGVGIPHHGDTVENWRVRLGRKNITADLSPRQRSGLPPDFDAAVENSDITALVVDPGPECRETDDNAAFQAGKFVGCLTPMIVRRGEENSGNFKCPMRYPFGEHSYYEPPGVKAAFRWTGTVTGIPPNYRGTLSWAGRERLPLTLKADAWEGRLLRYRADRETVPLGSFCSRITGTRINAGSGDSNHAGDAGRPLACQQFLVVNDTVLRGVR